MIEEYQYPPGYGMQPPQEESSLVKQTNPNAVLKEIEMTLRGKKWDEETQEWIKPIGCSPLINELGLNSIMADARGVINQNTILSNFNINQISKIIINFGRTVMNKIKMNWKEWEIDKSNLSTVLYTVTNPAYASLMRAMGEGEKRFLKTSVRAVESYTAHTKPSGEVMGNTTEKLKFWR